MAETEGSAGRGSRRGETGHWKRTLRSSCTRKVMVGTVLMGARKLLWDGTKRSVRSGKVVAGRLGCDGE